MEVLGGVEPEEAISEPDLGKEGVSNRLGKKMLLFFTLNINHLRSPRGQRERRANADRSTHAILPMPHLPLPIPSM